MQWISYPFQNPSWRDPVQNFSRLGTTVPCSCNTARLAKSERSPTLRNTPLLHCETWTYCTGWNLLQRFKICNLCQPEAQNIEQLHGSLTGVESCLQQSHSGVEGEYWILNIVLEYLRNIEYLPEKCTEYGYFNKPDAKTRIGNTQPA